jgi:hypothetical protein
MKTMIVVLGLGGLVRAFIMLTSEKGTAMSIILRELAY